MTLYDLAAEFNHIRDLICEESEYSEEELVNALLALSGDIKDKADGIACVIKELNAMIEAIKAEEKRLSERRKTKENDVERLKNYLASELRKCDIDRVETPRNKISFRASEGVVIDGDESRFIDRMVAEGKNDLLTFQNPKINKTAIKEALKNGEEILGARIERRVNLQIR